MIHNRKKSQPNWQIFLRLVLLLSMLGWNSSTVAAAGTTYYVDNTNGSCSDSGTGTTTAAPFCTIGKGASKAVAGDTVQVLAGNYAETITLPTSGSAGLPITFSAAPGVALTGAAGSDGFRVWNRSYIVIDGFTITSTITNSTNFGIYVSGSNNITISNNTITNTTNHGIYVSASSSNITIQNNTITNTTNYGIHVLNSNNITISNNHVSNSGTPNTGPYSRGINLDGTTDSTITGNTTDHNSQDGIRLTAGSNNNMVSNNTSFANAEGSTRNATGIQLTGSTGNTIIHNITYANEDTGLQFYASAANNLVIGNLTYGNGDHGIDFNASPSNTVVGNTVQGNVTAGINFEGASTPGSGGATVFNNIMVDNGWRLLEGQNIGSGTASGQPSNLRFDANSITGNTLDYNLFYLSSSGVQIQWDGINHATLAAFQTAVPGQETNGLEADPFFAGAAPIAQRPASAPYNVTVNVGDYHLTTGSPAIDSANSNAPSEPLLDLDGNPRVDDPATTNTGAGTRTYDDRGGYEFQPILLPVTITTPALNAGAGTNVTGVGTVRWTDPTNITAEDSSYATANLKKETSNYLEGTKYGFAIPDGATINGIVVTIGSFEDATGKRQDVRDNIVSLIKGGIITGTNQATGQEWPTGSPVGTTYGSTSDLWGTTWTPADINASNFGVALSANSINDRIASVDYMQISVTYTILLPPKVPVVTTQPVTSIGVTMATGNGTLEDLGAPAPTQYGVVWDTAANPTVALATKTEQGVPAGTGAFTSSITDLTPETDYHVRAYATNSMGTVYGEDVTFTTATTTEFYFANTTLLNNIVTDPNNGWISDDLYAIFDDDAAYVDYGFPSLGIPSNATITGIEVIIEGRQDRKSSRNLTVALWNASGSAFTETKTANLGLGKGNKDTNQALGGPTDTWGTTWTPADFATGTFKIGVGATSGTGRALLDAVSIRVYYSPATP